MAHVTNKNIAPGTWLILNQSQSAVFQNMLQLVAQEIGPCTIHTGSPSVPTSSSIVIVKAPKYRRSGVAARLMSWATFLAYCAHRTLFIPRPSFLLVTTNPPLLLILALFLGRLRGWKYGVLVWDIYPDHLVVAGILRKTNPIVLIWSSLNRMALERSELVVTVSDSMAKTITDQTPRLKASVVVIPSCCDTSEIYPIERSQNPFAEKHRISDRRVVMYSGNMGATHGLESLVDAAVILRARKDLIFVLIGDGLGRQSIEDKIRELALTNILLLPMQPENTLLDSLTIADIAVVIQSPKTENLSIPSKSYSHLSAGSAILALTDIQSDLGRMVNDEGVGLVCNLGAPIDIATAINQLLEDDCSLKAMKSRSRALAVTRFDIRMIGKEWVRQLRPLIALPLG